MAGVRGEGSGEYPVAPHIGEGAEDWSSPTLKWPGDLAWEVGDGGPGARRVIGNRLKGRAGN